MSRSTKQSASENNNQSLSTTAQKRKHRHTFRQSMNMDRTSTPNSNNHTANDNKNSIRDLGFVPRFLSNKGHETNNKSPINEDADAENDTNDDTDDFDSEEQRDNTNLYSQNIITGHQQQLQAQRRAESAANASYSKSNNGILVQRLRSLRATEQRMMMKLQSGQGAYSGATSNGSGAGGSVFMSRKRRIRSSFGGGNNNGNSMDDPRVASLSMLDVTVLGSSFSTTSSTTSANNLSLGEGKAVFPAYIHEYTMTKAGSAGEALKSAILSSLPCYAWIIMSQDVMREHGISIDGCMKQMRFYDAVVIPPRVVVSMNEEVEVEQGMHSMPTVVCTPICEGYPPEQPPLEDVSFEQFEA